MGASRTGNTCRTSKRPKESVTFVKFLPTMQEPSQKEEGEGDAKPEDKITDDGESCDLHVTVT